jgi:nitric oxide reductase subunit B
MARSKLAYSLYFLGLFNLMPAGRITRTSCRRPPGYAPLPRGQHTELLILGKILWDWRASLQEYQIQSTNVPAFAADIWVFVNLVLALIISVPAFNLVTHGTHITWHAMGSTIAINTMILLGSNVITLIVAGLGRGLYDGPAFQEMMQAIRPALMVFAVSGIALMAGLWIVIWHAFRLLGLVLSRNAVAAQPEPA